MFASCDAKTVASCFVVCFCLFYVLKVNPLWSYMKEEVCDPRGSTLPLRDPTKLHGDLPSSHVAHCVSGDMVLLGRLLVSVLLLFARNDVVSPLLVVQ
jgi:hypothetical protein